MKKTWGQSRDEWLKETSLPDEIRSWAIDSISKSEKEIYSLEEIASSQNFDEIEENLKTLRRHIKNAIALKEDDLDNLSLNTPNSYKLQVSVPSSLNYLMKAWAAAEGRDLSSVALQCLEAGLRAMKSKGSIPNAAVERYDFACEKRIALAEVNHAWEMHESTSYK